MILIIAWYGPKRIVVQPQNSPVTHSFYDFTQVSRLRVILSSQMNDRYFFLINKRDPVFVGGDNDEDIVSY